MCFRGYMGRLVRLRHIASPNRSALKRCITYRKGCPPGTLFKLVIHIEREKRRKGTLLRLITISMYINSLRLGASGFLLEPRCVANREKKAYNS